MKPCSSVADDYCRLTWAQSIVAARSMGWNKWINHHRLLPRCASNSGRSIHACFFFWVRYVECTAPCIYLNLRTVCNIIPNHGDLPVYIIPNNAGIYSSCALDHAMNHGCMKIMQAVLSDLGLRLPTSNAIEPT